MPGAPSGVLAPSSDARSPYSGILAPSSEPLVASLLLVAMPGAPSGVLAPSSDARSSSRARSP